MQQASVQQKHPEDLWAIRLIALLGHASENEECLYLIYLETYLQYSLYPGKKNDS